MKLPEYVTKKEVRDVCKELKIRDWTKLKQPKVTAAEARKILARIDTRGMKIALDDFREGLQVELEHGVMFREANVTNNHPILTGKIVLAHFKESLDYYQRLEVAELEGDLLKAIAANNMKKVREKSKKLAKAKAALAQAELKQLR